MSVIRVWRRAAPLALAFTAALLTVKVAHGQG
jgi:hypothetical protein